MISIEKKRFMEYTKDHSFILFTILLAIFVMTMFHIHAEYWNYSKDKMLDDPYGLTQGKYRYEASPWISVLMFATPLLAAVFLFDFIGLIDAYYQWESLQKERLSSAKQGKRLLLLIAKKRLLSEMAHLNDWLSSHKENRQCRSKQKTASDKTTSLFQDP